MKRIWLIIIVIAAAGAAGLLFFMQPQNQTLLPSEPNRIVSISPQVTEILFALKLDQRIAAVSSDSDYPPQVKGKPKVGTFWQPNMEAIIAVKPDLTITEKFEQHNNIADRLKSLGYPVLSVAIDNSIAELFEAIAAIGKATGTSSEAAALVGDIKGKLINLSGRFNTGRKYSVLWVLQTEPLRVAGRETFANELIELAGGYNAVGPAPQKYPPLGMEQLVGRGADVIIQPAMSGNIEAEQKAATTFWSKWQTISAVKNNRVYVIPADRVCRLGPRISEGVKLVAKCLHPDLFETAESAEAKRRNEEPNK